METVTDRQLFRPHKAYQYDMKLTDWLSFPHEIIRGRLFYDFAKVFIIIRQSLGFLPRFVDSHFSFIFFQQE